jgi:hypothetical protein
MGIGRQFRFPRHIIVLSIITAGSWRGGHNSRRRWLMLLDVYNTRTLQLYDCCESTGEIHSTNQLLDKAHAKVG